MQLNWGNICKNVYLKTKASLIERLFLYVISRNRSTYLAFLENNFIVLLMQTSNLQLTLENKMLKNWLVMSTLC